MSQYHRSYFDLRLISNRLLPCLKLDLINEVVVFGWYHLLVEFENEWARRRDVVLNDFLLVHLRKVLDDGSQ